MCQEKPDVGMFFLFKLVAQTDNAFSRFRFLNVSSEILRYKVIIEIGILESVMPIIDLKNPGQL